MRETAQRMFVQSHSRAEETHTHTRTLTYKCPPVSDDAANVIHSTTFWPNRFACDANFGMCVVALACVMFSAFVCVIVIAHVMSDVATVASASHPLGAVRLAYVSY